MSDENQPNDQELDLENTNTPVEDVNETIDAAMELEAATTEPAEECSEIDQLKAQVADAEKRVLMAHADLENYRKRTRRDMQDQMKYASLPLMNGLLESVDNLQRAIESYEQEPNADGLAEGVVMVAAQIAKVLEDHGCKKIDAVGQPFDPNLHPSVADASQRRPPCQHRDARPPFRLPTTRPLDPTNASVRQYWPSQGRVILLVETRHVVLKMYSKLRFPLQTATKFIIQARRASECITTHKNALACASSLY